MTLPRATMRLQFHSRFTFGDATALVSYLAALGISHLSQRVENLSLGDGGHRVLRKGQRNLLENWCGSET